MEENNQKENNSGRISPELSDDLPVSADNEQIEQSDDDIVDSEISQDSRGPSPFHDLENDPVLSSGNVDVDMEEYPRSHTPTFPLDSTGSFSKS